MRPEIRKLARRACAALFLALSLSFGETPRALGAAECLALIPAKSFRSREGLLQIFAKGFRSGAFCGTVMDRGELAALDKGIQTLFPLAACTRIEVGSSNLEIRFDQSRREAIPGTLRQAFLELSPRVVFALAPDTRDSNALVFRIQEGSVNVDFGAAARLWGFRRMEGTELTYALDEARRKSSLTLTSRRVIPRSKMKVARSGGEVTVTVEDEELGKNNQFVFAAGRVTFLGMKFQVLSNNAVQVGKGPVIRDPQTCRQITGLIEGVMAETRDDRIFEKGVVSVSSARYEMEDRRISLSRGYEKRE